MSTSSLPFCTMPTATLTCDAHERKRVAQLLPPVHCSRSHSVWRASASGAGSRLLKPGTTVASPLWQGAFYIARQAVVAHSTPGLFDIVYSRFFFACSFERRSDNSQSRCLSALDFLLLPPKPVNSTHKRFLLLMCFLVGSTKCSSCNPTPNFHARGFLFCPPEQALAAKRSSLALSVLLSPYFEVVQVGRDLLSLSIAFLPHVLQLITVCLLRNSIQSPATWVTLIQPFSAVMLCPPCSVVILVCACAHLGRTTSFVFGSIVLDALLCPPGQWRVHCAPPCQSRGHETILWCLIFSTHPDDLAPTHAPLVPLPTALLFCTKGLALF